jgi:hypothetical protein
MKRLLFPFLLLLLCLNVFAGVTQPSFEGQKLMITSDTDFYGSDKGLVSIDLNIENLDAETKSLFVKIKGLENYKVNMEEIKIDGLVFETQRTKEEFKQVTESKVAWSEKQLRHFKITLAFDSKEISLAQKFDIQLVNDKGELIADLDPFLSGWNFRKQMTITAPADKNIATSQILVMDVNTQALVLAGKLQADCDDLRVTIGDTNAQPISVSGCNTGSTKIYFKYEKAQLNATQTDTDWYFYYGNSGASAYTEANILANVTANDFNMRAYYNFNETSGDLVDRYNADNNGANTAVSYSEAGKLDTAYFYNGSSGTRTTLTTTGLPTAKQTITLWAKSSTANVNDGIFGEGTYNSTNFDIYKQEAGSSDGIVLATAQGTSVGIKSNITLADGNWRFIVASYDGATSRLWVDGVFKGAQNKTYTISPTGAEIGSNRGEYFTGYIDELGIFDYNISPTRIVQIYNAGKGARYCSELNDFFFYCPISAITLGSEAQNNQAPDINVTSPTADLNWNGTKAITFNVLDLDATNTLDVNLFYSSSAGARTNLIYHDTNLADASGITCSDYNFQDSTACTYNWDTTTAVDGLYYVDANVFDGTTSDQNSSPRFRVDNTKPVTLFAGCTTGWHNTNQDINLTCTDAGSGCNGTTYRLDDGTTTTYTGIFTLSTDGNHKIDYNSIDFATNVEITKTSYCAIDKTPPTIADPIFVGFTIFGSFINGTGTILGGLATDILSGIDQATCEYTLNGGGSWLSAVWNTDHCEATGVAIVNGTDYNIATRVDDQAGNTGTSDYNGTFTGDTTAPTTTDNASNNWTGANQTVTLTCGDGAGAGCKQTFYCVDATGTCLPNTIGTSVPVTCTAGNLCSQYVRYKSQDNVDNNETAHNSVLTRIDKENPTATSIAITDVAGRTEDQTPDLTISATDGSGAGLKEMAFSCNGSTWGSWISYNANYSSFDLRTGAGCTTSYGNKTVYLKVRDNVDNESTSTSDTTLLDAPVTFGDLNVFQLGVYTHNVDLNINSDINIVFQFNATSNDLNTQSAKVFYQSPFDDANCSGYIRGAIQCGFKEEDNIFSVQNKVGTTFTMRSIAEDDHTFKPYFYNADPDLFETKSATPLVLNSSNVWGKTLISNVLVDNNIFFNLSFYGFFTGAVSRTMNVYDCNADVANPATSPNCWSQPFTNIDLPQLDGYFSIYHESNDSNQVNGVQLDADGNHFIYYNCPTCTGTQYWTLAQIDTNSNVDKTRNWSSTTGLGGFTANVRTLDTHIHALDLKRNNIFTAYFTIDNNQGKTYTSNQYNEEINIVNLAPHIDAFNAPIAEQYSGTIDVNIEVADPELNTIVCDFNLVTPALAHVAVIAESVSPVGKYCTADFNSLLYSDGNYLVKARVRETTTYEKYFQIEYSENFRIQNEVNDPPTILVVQPNGSEVFTKLVDTPIIILTLQDPDTNELYVDVNYSDTNQIGTGTQILLNENVLTSPSLICDSGDFSTDTNCSYSWNIASVPDGNYFLVVAVSDGILDSNDASDAYFTIQPSPPVPVSTDYVERYIAPDSKQRDSNIYFNPTSAFALSESEKQTQALQTTESNIFLFGIIIIVILAVIAWFIWKRK